MRTLVVMVTPELADKMLKKNTGNRKVRPIRVRRFVTLLKQGRFKLTHQGVAITKSGRVLDGQHRLLAIVESGIGHELNISYDVDEKTFDVIDTGDRKNFSDHYGVDQRISAVVRLLATIHYKQTSFESADMLPVYKAIHETAEALLAYCPKSRPILTCAQVQAAAVVRILAGEDRDYVYLVYEALANFKIEELPAIGKAFVTQVLQRNLSHSRQGGGKATGLFVRALKLFDKSARDTNRLQIVSSDSALEFTRETLKPLVKGKAPVKEKPPGKAAPRAKALPLSRKMASNGSAHV